MSFARNKGMMVAGGASIVLIFSVTSVLVGGRHSDNRGQTTTPTVAPEVPITAMNLQIGAANNSPRLLADPTQPDFLALANRIDAPDFSCALQISGDGGRGWQTAHPVRALPPGADKCYGPEIAFDNKGVLYYLFIGLEGRGNQPMGVFLTKSADRGRTFSTPSRVLGGLNFGVRMAIDPTHGRDGRLHLVWLSATSDPPRGGFGPPPNPILATYSDDSGQTFSEPIQVSDSTRQRVVAPALTLGPNGHVYVAYYDLHDDIRDYAGLEGPTWDGTWSLVVATSSNSGADFGRGGIVDDAIVPTGRVMLVFTMPPAALVADKDRVCAAWSDGRNGDPDVVLRCSPDRGETWQGLRRLNDDGLGNGSSQYLPQVAISPTGRMDAVFYDRRADPENFRNDVYYTYSTDWGESFAKNVRLNRFPSDSRIGPEYAGPAAAGQYEFGSRMALLSDGDGVLASWADTRNSRAGTTSQDLFATVVHYSSSDTEAGNVLPAVPVIAVGLGLCVLLPLAAALGAAGRGEPRTRGWQSGLGADGIGP